jgi:hypothetical protein
VHTQPGKPDFKSKLVRVHSFQFAMPIAAYVDPIESGFHKEIKVI